ncbi:MAG: hypothetical protein PHE54_04525 [Bacilli bacterium]|nr:hypothetical protein [Bacilli bacterium]
MFSETHLCNINYKLQPFFEKIVAQEIKNINKRDTSRLLEAIKNELILRLHSQKLNVFDDNDATDVISFDLLQSDEGQAFYEEIDLFGEYFLMKHGIKEEDFSEKIFGTVSPIMKAGLAVMLPINKYAQDTYLFPYLVMNIIAMKDASKLRLQRKRLMQQAKSCFNVDYTEINVPKQLNFKK